MLNWLTAWQGVLTVPQQRKLKQTIKALHPVHETTPGFDQKHLYVSERASVFAYAPTV